MQETVAITGARALAGVGLEPVEDAVVLVRGGKIVAAGDRPPLKPPAGARIEDAQGLTLIPGFIDAHVHIGLADPHDVVAGGVTTVRDLGWPPGSVFPLAARSRSASFDGPLVLAAGPMLTAPGGYPTRAAWAPAGTGLEVESAAAAADAVARVAQSGAWVVKVALDPRAGPILPAQTLRAVVAAAHERGLKVTGHVFGVGELEKAVDAGVDELAHMLMSGDAIPSGVLARMVSAGMTIVPTLSIRFGRDRRVAIDNLRRFLLEGGRVVYGTDLGNHGPRPGIDAAEIEAMTAAGMSGRDVVAAATVKAAAWLGLHDKGALEPGRDADLVGLAGSPLASAANLSRVAAVWRCGRRVR